MKTFSAIAKLLLILQFASASVLAGNLSESHISIDLTQLSRDSGKSITYLYDNGGSVNSPGDDTPLASTSSFSDTADLGYRLSGSKKLSNKWSINGQILTSKFNKNTSFSSTDRLEIFQAAITDTFDGADSVQSSYKSDLSGEEINAIYQYSDTVAFIFGLGHISLDENMKLTSDDTGNVGTYTIHTDNALMGLQAGAAINHKQTDKFGMYLVGKIGFYNNDTDQNQQVTDSALTRSNSGSGKETSTVTDLRLGLNYSFTNQFELNLGYQMLSISNVALAESHFNTSAAGSNVVIGSGDVKWNGVTLGLNYNF